MGVYGIWQRQQGVCQLRARRLVETTSEALLAGIQQVTPGATLGDVGHAIQSVAHREHFSVVCEYCGHGIGQVYHEDPQVLHYGQRGHGLRLEVGMVFTIEPMLNAGKRDTNKTQLRAPLSTTCRPKPATPPTA